MSFLITEKCVGCTLCAKVCPVSAINGSFKEVHQINEKRCVSCSVCGKVCPKGAIITDLHNSVSNEPRNQWKKPIIDVTICSACSMCVEICNFNCIKIPYPKFKGDLHVHANLENPKECVGCGLCARICPINAIKMGGYKQNE